MSAPDHLWIEWTPADADTMPATFSAHTEKSRQEVQFERIDFIRKDASDAAIASARAEGVREGMLKAAEIAGGMLINSYRADGVVEYRDFVAVAIRAAAKAQP